MKEMKPIIADMQKAIMDLLTHKLGDRFKYQVTPWNGMSSQYLKIAISPDGLRSMQCVSLSLSEDLELKPQIYGGEGGNSIYREPNKEDAKEKYLAMKSVTVPFRKPQQNKDAVLRCIDRFADAYIKTLTDNRDKLCYRDVIDFDHCFGN